MKFDLSAIARRTGHRRKLTPLRPIKPTQAQAQALAAIYRQMLAPWERERIEAAYAAELTRVLTTDSPDDLTRLFEGLGDAVNRLVLELTPDLREWAFSVEAWHRRRWRDTVLSGAGVDLQTLIGPQDVRETVERVVARNVALVRDISAQARGRISDAVFRGLGQRLPAREVGREIAESIGMARKRADRVAADQAVKLASALDAERQRQAGIEVVKYVHSGKLHPRSWHRARDGKLYELDTLKEVEFEAGEKRYTGARIERTDFAGQPPFCGCATAAVLVIDGVVL